MRCESFQRSALIFDIYKKPIQLRQPDGADEYRTCMGSLLSFCTIAILALYASYKLTSLANFEDYKVLYRIQEHYFESDDWFGKKEGFKVAAAILNLEGQTEVDIDPRIGSIHFYKKTWGDDGTSKMYFNELRDRKCTEDDMNDALNSNPESGFYALDKDADHYMKLFGINLFHCLVDDNDVKMHGDFDSAQAANLMISFEKCDYKNTPDQCESKEFIENWVQGRYLSIMTN